MTLSDKSMKLNEKLRLLIRKLEEAYNRQVEIEKQLRKELAAKAGAEQGRADAEAALEVANAEIGCANVQIRELADAGKRLCDRAIIASHRNSAATMYEVAKGIIVLALIVFNFHLKAQGLICGMLWSGMMIWSYTASITFKKLRILENIWFLLFSSLSFYLLHRYNIVQICGVDDFLLRLLSGNRVLNYVAISCVMMAELIMTSHSWWRRKRIDDGAADAETKAAYSAFFNPQIFPQVEIVSGTGVIDRKTSTDDEGREELYRGHEYLHIVFGTDALPDDNKDAKIIYDDREDDSQDAIVAYSVVSLEKLEQLKHPDRQEKQKEGNDGKDGKETHRRR